MKRELRTTVVETDSNNTNIKENIKGWKGWAPLMLLIRFNVSAWLFSKPESSPSHL